MSLAAPHMIEPTRNNTDAMMNKPFLPIMSPTLPYTGIVMVHVST